MDDLRLGWHSGPVQQPLLRTSSPAGANFRLMTVLTAAIVFGGVIATGLWFVLIHWQRLGPVGWKRAEYVIIALATLGVVTAAADIRQRIASNEAASIEQFAEGEYRRIRSRLDLTQSTAYCGTQIEPFEAVCEWGREAELTIPVDPPRNLDPVTNDILPPTDGLQEGLGSGQPIWEIERTLSSHNTAAESLAEARDDADNTLLEDILFALAPFLLAAAGAFALVKNRAEILALREDGT